MSKASRMIRARKLFKDVSDLPTIPVVVSRVLSLLDKNDADQEEIANLILSDQVLAARVIRLVNSPIYRSNNEITSVKRALVYLGFKSVREMIITSSFIESFNNKEQEFDMKPFWMHSFSVGAMSRHIATQIGYPDAEKAYLVGIIHDIGKVFLCYYCKNEYDQILVNSNNANYNIYEDELDIIGTTHCEIGLCLGQLWNFPADYCEVISCHHTSETATEDPLLTAIVSMADYFCLSRLSAINVDQARLPGLSEENAWNVIRQFSKRPLADEIESFFSQLSEAYEEVSREIDQLFNTMTAA